MPFLTQSQVHIDAALTNFAVAIMQDPNNFVADRVFPVQRVEKQSDKYFTWPIDTFLRTVAQKRVPGTKAVQRHAEVSNDSYSADIWSVETPIPDERRANADAALNLDQAATGQLTNDMLIAREIEWVGTFFTTGVWGQDYTGVASAPAANQFVQWNDQANSDPITDVQDGHLLIQRKTGLMPNRMVVGASVHKVLTRHPLILERIKFTGGQDAPAIVTRAALASIFEVDEYMVANAVQVATPEGATADGSFIAGNNVLLTHTPDTPDTMSPMPGTIFAWDGAGFDGNAGVAIDRRREDDIKSDVVRAEFAFDMKLTSSPLGVFFSGAIAG